jgi:hypothetical protein
MAKKQLTLTLNLGNEDKKALNIEDPATEGQVVSVDDKTAATLLKKGWAVEHDPAPADAKVAPRKFDTPPKGNNA